MPKHLKILWIVLAVFIAAYAVLIAVRHLRAPAPLPPREDGGHGHEAAPPPSSEDAQVGPVPVLELDEVAGKWVGQNGSWADLRRQPAKKLAPWPWTLTMWPWGGSKAPDGATSIECGFFHTLTFGKADAKGFRVAHCSGGLLDPGPRHALRLVLLEEQGTLQIELGTSYTFQGLSRETK